MAGQIPSFKICGRPQSLSLGQFSRAILTFTIGVSILAICKCPFLREQQINLFSISVMAVSKAISEVDFSELLSLCDYRMRPFVLQ
jgi:hypothetical protein